MNLFRKRLPPVPTGYEYVDLLWSQLVPRAATYLEVLPRTADPVWATEYGLTLVELGLRECETASAELRRTRSHSTLRLVRQRNLRRLEARYRDLVLTLMGALVEQARKRYPKASPAQLFTVARDSFRDLLRATFPIEGMNPTAGKTKNQSKTRSHDPQQSRQSHD